MRKKIAAIITTLFLVLGSLTFMEVRATTLQGYVKSMDGREIPITITYEAQWESEARYILKTIVESVPLLEDLWGVPYIYKSINVETFNAAAQSGMILLGYNELGTFSFNTHPDAGLSRETIIHELNHSWHFGNKGNSPPSGTVNAAWFNDASSMGNTYIVLKELGAEEEGSWELEYRTRFFVKYMKYDVPLVKWGYQSGKSTEENIKTLIGYSKGFLFWLRLNDVVGKDVLKRVWKRVFENTPMKTEDLTRIIEEEYGGDLTWLWSGWLYPGEYKDPWWKDWRENLPQQLDKLRQEIKDMKDEISGDGFSISQLEKELDGADELLAKIKVDEARDKYASIEIALTKAQAFLTAYTEFKSLREKNSSIIEQYGGSLSVGKKMDEIKSLFASLKIDEATSGLAALSSQIMTLSETVTNAKKILEETNSFVVSAKKDFEKEGLTIAPIEEKVAILESAFSSGDFDRVQSLSPEIEAMMGAAKVALDAYEASLGANRNRGFLGTDSQSLISQAREEFNRGNYVPCKELSLQAQEQNKQTNMTPLIVVAIVVIIAVGAIFFFMKKKSKREMITEEPKS
jgi:predicted  nucleic acid-binding Zn-ribbon protein